MEMKPFTLPQPLARVVSRLPAYPPTLAFVQAVNLALGDMLRSDRLDGLRGKTIRIRVKDGGLTLDFVLARKGLVACKQGGNADLTISAKAYDFLMLALRREDP